jgi:hypothetical protein
MGTGCGILGSGTVPDGVTIPQMRAESNAASASGAGQAKGTMLSDNAKIGAQIAVL